MSEPSEVARIALALVGTWDVTVAGGVPTPADVHAHLTFEAPDEGGPEGRMYGRGGVNNLAGGYTVEVEGHAGAAQDQGGGVVLVIGPVISTLMAGPEEAMAHEYRLTSALDGRLALAIDDDGDVVTLGDGAVELRRQI